MFACLAIAKLLTSRQIAREIIEPYVILHTGSCLCGPPKRDPRPHPRGGNGDDYDITDGSLQNEHSRAAKM
jgi:hypothetical protein